MGVDFSPLETKPQLYEKIKQNKQIPKTDVVAMSHGHFVLRLPVRHCELNPIELIWANVKSYLVRNNTTFKLSDVRNLVYEAFGHIDANVWQKAEQHVRGIEVTYAENDGAYRAPIEPIVINLTSDSDDSDLE